MAGNIQGITIKFKGETTELEQAIKKVNSATKEIDKNLKEVNNALKFNPTKVDLWRQKQDLLNAKIDETDKNLKSLKDMQSQLDAKGVDKNSAEYQKLQREIITTESKLKTFKGQLNSIGNVKLKAASEQFKQWGSSLTEAGQKMQGLSTAAAAVVASLGAISYKAGQNADDLNTLSKVYSLNTTDLQKYSVAADLVDVSVEDIAKSHVKLEKSMYSAQNGSASMQEAFDKLGVSVVDSNGELRSGDEVWQETIQKLGQMQNETERDALAMQLMGKSAANLNPLIADQGETYKNLTETLQKYNLDFVDQETLDGANQFNDALDEMKAIGSVALMTVGSQLAGYLAPAIEKVVGWIGQLASWLTSLSPEVLTVIGVVAGVVAAIAPVLLILGKLAFAVSSIMSLASTLGTTIGALAGPFGIAIAVIAAIIAIGVLLYKNWDTIKAKALEIKDSIIKTWNALKSSIVAIFNAIKTTISNAWRMIKLTVGNYIRSTVNEAVNKWNSLKQSATTIWNNIKTAITRPIQAAKEKVKAAVDKLKSLFPLHIGKIFSGLKVPHFHISGGKAPFGIGGKGSKPSISVDWYKRAMDNPYMFSTPTFFGAGEAGDEMLYGRAALMRDISEAVSRGGGNGNSPSIVININGANASPKEIAEEVKRTLIRETNQRRLAWQ